MFTNLAILWDPYLVGRHFNGKIINKSQSNSFPLPGRQEAEIKTSKIQKEHANTMLRVFLHTIWLFNIAMENPL